MARSCASARSSSGRRRALAIGLEGCSSASVVVCTRTVRAQVLPEHMASNCLEFNCDFSSGRNFARQPGGADVPSDGGYARSVARAVPDGDGDGEGGVSEAEARLVGRALREAVHLGGDGAAVQHLLSSCYCPLAAVELALCEVPPPQGTENRGCHRGQRRLHPGCNHSAANHTANHTQVGLRMQSALQPCVRQPSAAQAAKTGHAPGVKLLLAARATPCAQPAGLGKTALHAAAEAGHEAIARLLVAVDPQAAGRVG